MTPELKRLEEMGKFATVVVDPPWDTGGFMDQNSTNHDLHSDHAYPALSIAQIQVMPVVQVCAADAWVFLWTTSKLLPKAFLVLDAWGIAYAFTMTWGKHFGPKPSKGPTYNAEYIVVGKRGKARFTETKGFDLMNTWPHQRRDDVHPNGWGHAVYANSGKPEGFYDLLRRVTPGPRLDIFGRRRIAGFESWGNEAPEGPALPDYYQQVLI